MRQILSHSLSLLLCCCLTSLSLAEDKKTPEFDLQKLMAAMEKAGTPSDHHKKLDPLVGSWDYTVKFWMDPNQPAMTMKGAATRKWIFDGRYIQEEIVNDGESMPFKGLGLMGYDNLRNHYNAIWVDSMSTSIFNSKGKLSKDGKVFTFTSNELDPLSKKPIKTRDLISIHSKDKHTMTAYRTMPGVKKEWKVMEIIYTRKK